MDTITFKINVPTGKTQEILDDFCEYHGYTDTIQDPIDETKTIPNPVTKAVYAKSKIAGFIKESIKAYRCNLAINTARTTKSAEVEALEVS